MAARESSIALGNAAQDNDDDLDHPIPPFNHR
jgi:hypothetical protein